MKEKTKRTQSEVDGVQYRRVPTWQIALGQLNSGAGMCFYILMGYASYVASEGYGMLTAVVGLLLTVTRVFDGITDPLIAMVIDKLDTKFGKIRIMICSGWVIEAFAVKLLYDWASGKGHGVVMFVILYMLYVIGYTMNNVTAQIIGPVMTNDPKQRPLIGVWSTVYNYLFPMIFSMVITLGILPRYGNQYTVPMLAEASWLCVGVTFVLVILCCIGVSKVDRPENFQGINVKDKEPVKFKDMLSLLKSNRALQTYIISAASDKLAQQTASQSIVSTMLFGIIIGNMQLSMILSVIAMLPSIIFAILGAKYCGKHGSKESTVTWNFICLGAASAGVLFFVLIDPTNIATKLPYMIVFVLLTLAMNGSKMCVTTSSGAMMADIIDYELDRSGKYMPAAVTATYSFIDKLISSLGATIATGCVAMIGYTSTMPQPTDQATPAIFWLTIAIYYGMPMFGWGCTLIAMKYSPLSKEKMVEIQKNIASKKAAALQETSKESAV